MFLPQRVDITHVMDSAREHELQIDFDSALLRAREIEKQHPEHKFICFNGDTARLAVRKAQCHWGWDWGPFLMCAGIWKPIRLEVYAARIADIRTEVELATDYNSALIRASAEVEGADQHKLRAKFNIVCAGKTITTAEADVSSSGAVNVDLKIDSPELWMPSGYGKQTLYNVEVSLVAEDELVHADVRRIGLRKVELIQEPDSRGKSFYFRINGVDIFCGGSCWIPADSLLTNITPERYRAWIELMVPANQKMIR